MHGHCSITYRDIIVIFACVNVAVTLIAISTLQLTVQYLSLSDDFLFICSRGCPLADRDTFDLSVLPELIGLVI